MPTLISHFEHGHLHTRVITVTQVYANYDSYLKIGPNQKKKGLDCHTRQALFTLITTTIFKTLVFETPPY